MTAPEDARRALVELTRSSGRDVLATLARWCGDLALAGCVSRHDGARST